jgi:hypothetical protein
MQPGRYTELFFLDEATALAAGHRPCGMCRNSSYLAFKKHWLSANEKSPDMPVADMDKLLHAERNQRQADGEWFRQLADLPSGVMVHWKQEVHIWDGTSLRRWAPTGYDAPECIAEPSSEVVLVTPPSVVRAIAAGYAVQTHESSRT